MNKRKHCNHRPAVQFSGIHTHGNDHIWKGPIQYPNDSGNQFGDCHAGFNDQNISLPFTYSMASFCVPEQYKLIENKNSILQYDCPHRYENMQPSPVVDRVSVYYYVICSINLSWTDSSLVHQDCENLVHILPLHPKPAQCLMKRVDDKRHKPHS